MITQQVHASVTSSDAPDHPEPSTSGRLVHGHSPRAPCSVHAQVAPPPVLTEKKTGGVTHLMTEPLDLCANENNTRGEPQLLNQKRILSCDYGYPRMAVGILRKGGSVKIDAVCEPAHIP